MRPAVDERSVVDEVRFDAETGVDGDTWHVRPTSTSPTPNPEAQVTLMNARAAALIAGDRSRWPLAGDQLYVDLDLSGEHLPPGTRAPGRDRGARGQREAAHRVRQVLGALRERRARGS